MITELYNNSSNYNNNNYLCGISSEFSTRLDEFWVSWGWKHTHIGALRHGALDAAKRKELLFVASCTVETWWGSGGYCFWGTLNVATVCPSAVRIAAGIHQQMPSVPRSYLPFVWATKVVCSIVVTSRPAVPVACNGRSKISDRTLI